ncbi:MAG: D-2-hydroxyacid dehydrogenase [Fimbriimonas sp.]
MRIVVLDGHTLSPGDLDLSPLQDLGEVAIHPRTPVDEVVTRGEGAPILLTNKVPIDRATLERLPDLRYIGVLATGFNVVDTEAARERGVVVSNVPAYSTESVAQLTFGLILTLTHRLDDHVAAVRGGRWAVSPDFSFWNFPLIELSGETLGLIGYGNIGRAVARIALAFGMRVLVEDRGKPVEEGVWAVSRERLLAESRFISLHCPLTPQNRQMVDDGFLRQMREDAFLINTARGGLVDEEALAKALKDGRIAGAGVDVLSQEPPAADNPLLHAPNCVVTAHIAWATQAARARLLRVTVENIKAFLDGRPQNVVNP